MFFDPTNLCFYFDYSFLFNKIQSYPIETRKRFSICKLRGKYETYTRSKNGTQLLFQMILIKFGIQVEILSFHVQLNFVFKSYAFFRTHVPKQISGASGFSKWIKFAGWNKQAEQVILI